MLPILALLAFSCASINAMELTHKDHDFYVGNHKIQRAYIDKEIRGISDEQLNQLASMGAYLKLKKMDDSNDYALHLGGRLNGGGPGLGKAAYWTVKVGGYIGYSIVCIFHPQSLAEAPEVNHAIDAVAAAAEIAGNIVPGP